MEKSASRLFPPTQANIFQSSAKEPEASFSIFLEAELLTAVRIAAFIFFSRMPGKGTDRRVGGSAG
jgi:hypothetical protein